MPSIKTIKQRIKSVKSTSQITKAMEVVSATKMRRSQEFAIKARPYAVASLELLQNLLHRSPVQPALLKSRPARLNSRSGGPVKKSALLVVTSDKGLAGAFNANVLRRAQEWHAAHPDSAIFTIGKKAREYFERRRIPLLESYSEFGDFTELSETVHIADRMISGFLNTEWDEVDAVYTNFRTTLLQEATVKKILPVTEKGIREVVSGILPQRGRYADGTISNFEFRISKYNFEYTFEPSVDEILNTLIPQLIRLHIHHIILESNASEHSARMIAMKNASDNAKGIITDLTLVYNKVRQAGITRELTEITAGKEALEE